MQAIKILKLAESLFSSFVTITKLRSNVLLGLNIYSFDDLYYNYVTK